MVNVTNDGWFRGSSELDMHLACGVFRAIEMRKPLLIAGWTIMAVRLGLVSVVQSPKLIVAIQALDGLANGLFAVMAAACGRPASRS